MTATKNIEGLMDLVSELESKAESAGHPLGNLHGIAPLRIEIEDYTEAIIAQEAAALNARIAELEANCETLNDLWLHTVDRRAALEVALTEWSEKTEFVQRTAQPGELGMHRADVLKQRLEAALAAQGAGAHRFKTSEAGRACVKQFFNGHLQRHDFDQYIEKHLAADFACALSDGLAAQGAEPVGYCEQKALDQATNLGPGEATFVLVAAKSEKVWSVPIYTRPPAAEQALKDAELLEWIAEGGSSFCLSSVDGDFEVWRADTYGRGLTFRQALNAAIAAAQGEGRTGS